MNFFARKNEQSRFTVAVALMIVMALELILPITTAKSQSGSQGPSVIPGQTATRLPDGRWLLAGGQGAGRSLGTAAIWNPLTGNTTALTANLQQARAWHSATILPEGQVLILGGLGSDGRAIQSAEIFNPETQTFSSLAIDSLSARARHTTTLLTDGHVLISGGIGATGETLATADLWSSNEGTVTALAPMGGARLGHTATLLADGRVLLWAGADSFGQAQNSGELFDTITSRFTQLATFPAALFPSSTDAPSLAASLPPDRMVNVPSDALIALRFSKLLRFNTIGSETLTLSGPKGIEKIKAVIAEDGRLIFITPESLLLSGATYTVTINGARDRDGLPLPVSGFSFSTPQSPGSAVVQDPSTQSGLQVVSQQPAKTTPPAQVDADDDWVWKGAKLNGKPHSPWQDLGPLKAERGETALAGQVLDLKGDPLQNVTLKMAGEYGSESVTVLTDETGRFLLTEIQSGEGSMLIDGRSANRPGRTYGIFEVYIKIKDGETNILPYTIWMPRIDTAHAVKIDSPTKTEIILTTPKIPDLEVHIPPGTVIRDHEYNIVTEIGITPMPLDRPPFALPPQDVKPPAFFTVQPGVSRIYSPNGGARLIYPNYTENPKPPRSRFDSWHYDAEHRGWYIYGQGTVTENGKQVVPDAGVSIYKTTGAMIGNDPAPPPKKPNDCGEGDPVDLCTGLFLLSKTDLYLPDIVPITLTRTYRTDDNASRPFGIGSTHPYNIYLYSINDYQDADLVLADGKRIHYVRISPGTGFTDAVYENATTPGTFYKSTLAWNGQGWSITLKDGTVYKFPESCPGCPSGGLNIIQDRNGNKIVISRTGTNQFDDPVGNITQITSPNGRWIKFSYDSGNRITQARDNGGRTINYEYDAIGRLIKVTDPNGGISQYTYDSSNRMLTVKNPRNITVVTNEYDTNGRVFKQTLANGGIYTFAYTLDVNGNVAQTDVTDPRGYVRRVLFDSNLYATSDTHALGTLDVRAVTFERQPGTNLLLSYTNAMNQRTSFTYDALGNTTSITRLSGTPGAVTTSYTYDSTFNALASITNPLSLTTTLSRDAKGNVSSVSNPLHETTIFTRDSAGQVTSVTNPSGQTVLYSSDLGDISSISDPMGQTTDRFVDGLGRTASVTNPLGQVTRYEYDFKNYLTKIIDPLNGETRFVFDPNGNLLNGTDARNNATTYTYDNSDRALTRTDALLKTEHYQYDLMENIVEYTGRNSQTRTYSYDALNRLKTATYSDPSTRNYTYDAENRLVQIDDSVAGTITRTYDDLNRLTQETTPQGSLSYTYDSAGRRTSMTVTGQPPVSYAYDNANRLVQIAQGSSVISFTYDNSGRRTGLTFPNGVSVEYVYDNASRVTNLTYKYETTVLGDLSYEYDGAGNRTKTSGSFARTGVPQGIAATAYNGINQQTTFSDRTLTYDNNGNVTSITDGNGTTLYSWNVKNQLVGINGPGVNATFVYDGLGRRQRKIVNGNSIEFLYDGLNPVQELNGSSVLTNMLTGLGIDEVFARSNASGAQYLLPDVIGSVIAVADSTATIHTEYTYEPFGRTTSSGNSVGTPFQFTGRENDETGLYFYRARYYDPQLQRFISQDRIFNLMSPNRYGYALDNPLRFVDRDGNSPVAVALCLACLATLPLAAAAGCVSGCLGSCNFTDCLKDCLDLKQTNPTLSTIATLLCGVVCAAAGIPDDTTEDPGNGPDPGKQNPAPTPDQDFEYKKAA